MSTRRRIVSGTIANIVALAMSAIAQLVSVPILVNIWGIEKYGIWLMLITIPTYFALSDFGFASAATSQMTMQAAKGEFRQARATFQSVWVLLNCISFALLVVSAIGLGAGFWLDVPSSAGSDTTAAIALLVLYCALAMNTRIVLGGLRATQNYAVGTLVHDAFFIVEVYAVLLCAWRGLDLTACAGVMALVRGVNLVILCFILRWKVPWLRLGVQYSSKRILAELLKPSLAAMAIPSALAINLQGMMLVAGITVSTGGAATFASVRTVSRILVQVVGAVNRATMPEFSAADAQRNSRAIGAIIGVNVASVLVLLLPGAIGFGLFGGKAVQIWTHDKIHPNSALVILISASMVAHALWYYICNLLLALNSHSKVAAKLVLFSIAAILFSFPVGRAFGLNGIAFVLAGSEVACLLSVLRACSELNLLKFEYLTHGLRLRFTQAKDERRDLAR